MASTLFFGQSLLAQEAPKTYVAQKAIAPLAIDGMADEASWKAAPWTDDFIDIEGDKKPLYRTRMKMLWDQDNLYFYAELGEPQVWGDITKRDAVIFHNNDFELFIDPDGDTHNYYEFEINVLNTVWDLFLTKPYRNQGKVLNGWNMNDIVTATHINGTLNDPKDIDKGWSVEIAIPWHNVVEASNTRAVPEGDFWRINFSRVNWEYEMVDGKYARKKDPKTQRYLPEYNWVWSPQEVINMHEPERWGYIYFSPTTVGTAAASFTAPKDDHIKWWLYSLYRQYRFQKEPAIGANLPKATILGEEVQPKLERNTYGWDLTVKSPFTGKLLRIAKDGRFYTEDQN